MSTTRTFRNTSDKFGDVGPLQASSKEAIADEMRPTFESWIDEAEATAVEMAHELGIELPSFNRAEALNRLRDEFIAALEEI